MAERAFPDRPNESQLHGSPELDLAPFAGGQDYRDEPSSGGDPVVRLAAPLYGILAASSRNEITRSPPRPNSSNLST